MPYSSQITINHLRTYAAKVLLQLAAQREPIAITQNGVLKAVLQDFTSYENTQETLALLKFVCVGNHEIKGGKVKPVAVVVAGLRAKRSAK